METKIVEIGGKTYKIMYKSFDEDIDIDDLLKIDYSNLIGEIVTYPVIVNRFGQMLAEAESQLSEAKLNLDILEAKLKEELRTALTDEKGKAPTIDALNNAVLQKPSYQTMRRRCIEIQKVRDYMNSVFWSSKDKSEKINKLSTTIQPGDVDTAMIEGKVNNVIIKQAKKLIN